MMEAVFSSSLNCYYLKALCETVLLQLFTVILSVFVGTLTILLTTANKAAILLRAVMNCEKVLKFMNVLVKSLCCAMIKSFPRKVTVF